MVIETLPNSQPSRHSSWATEFLCVLTQAAGLTEAMCK